jgi:hypothetical protein
MSNAIYPKYKQALLDASANVDLNDGTVKVALIDTGVYPYNGADEFYSSVSGVVGTPQTINNTTVTNGLFDGDDVTFPAVTGNPAEAILIYIDTGSAATSRLVAWIDTATNLPVTPNGGDISIQWNASGIFQL